MGHWYFLRARLIAIVGLVFLPLAPALAQSTAPAPVRAAVDEYGVDLFDGTYSAAGPALTMGGEDNGISYRRTNRGDGWSDSTIGYLQLDGNKMTVSIGGLSDTFTDEGGSYESTEWNGSTLTYSSGLYTYTRSDGTVAHFDETRFNEDAPYGNKGTITDMVMPDGTRLDYSYSSITYCKQSKPSASGYICLVTAKAYRLAKVTSSYGYELRPVYPYYEWFYDPFDAPVLPDFGTYRKVLGMTGHNLASDTNAAVRSQSFDVVYDAGSNWYTITDDLSRDTRYKMAGAAVAGIKLPGSTSEDISFTYTSGKVTAVTTPAGTTSYARSDSAGQRTVTVTHPLSRVETYVFDIASRRLKSYTDPVGKTTTYQYDGNGRVTRITAPEGNQVRYTYDSRGNVTEQRMVAKTAGSPPDIVTTAGYDSSCSNPVKCNSPNWTKDALGKQTDYTYDATHGGVLTVTGPAPSTGAARPQVRYSYSSYQAYYKHGSTSPTASGVPVYRMTQVSTCISGSSCTGTADEVKTTVSYGPQTSGTGNNLLPVSVTKQSGDGSLTATTAMSYDAVGNLVSVDGPLSGTADTTVVRYDALRRKVGTIGPDPDGGGALKNPAQRITYNTRGQVTLSEEGYTAGQTDAAWTGFTAGASVESTYTASGQVETSTTKNGSTVYALTQYGYDAAGRLQCTAQRMNTAIYGSLPSSACSLGTPGAAGPDRITKTTYDAADRPTLVQTAYGTSAQANEVTTAYTDNGQVAYVVDGEGNRTTYEYDGHDRPIKTRYPVATKGANSSSTTDYSQLTYGDNVRVTQQRLRDGNTISASYDNLSRVTQLSGSTIDNRTMTYNLLGQPLAVTYTSGGQSVVNSYDAFGRLTAQTVPQGSISYQYDVASRMTRMTWPDAFYAVYDYDTLGRVTKIRENGASSGIGVLATYAYDNLGRRSSVTYGNGTTRTYGVDPLGRLQGLKINLASTSSDQLIGKVGSSGTAMAYNPASQITSITKSNDAYAWDGHVDVDRDYTANGLNQYTAAGGVSFGYDARGNLTSSGSTTYTYDGFNQLKSVSGGPTATLTYDPVGRLYQLTSGGSTSRFLYDDGMMVAEYDGSNALQRRFVPGPGVDEPVVWYEGSGTTDRRFLQGDERGSIVVISNAAGAMIAINSYDEYGIPGSANTGRFGYTGQVWLDEIGLSYYKARMYSPSLGRFMQTDPIGYADGMNWYAYVGNDPVNKFDSTGLLCEDNVEDCTVTVSGFREKCSAGFTCYTGPEMVSMLSNMGLSLPQEFLDSHKEFAFLHVVTGKKEKKKKPKKGEKPDYCSSIGYRVGDFVDGAIGGTLQNVGIGGVVAGGAVGLATGITGVGAGAGGAIAAGGGGLYAVGTTVSTIGVGIKWLSGQDPGVTMTALLSVPTMRLGPASQIVTEQALSYLGEKAVPNPCD